MVQTFKRPLHELTGYIKQDAGLRVSQLMDSLQQVMGDTVKTLLILCHLPGPHHELGDGLTVTPPFLSLATEVVDKE